MCNVRWIVADTHFLAAISELLFNREFKWYQRKDPNIGCHGYFSLHRTIQTYVQLRDLDRMQNTWEETDAFAAYRYSYDVFPSDTKKNKDMQRNYFFE